MSTTNERLRLMNRLKDPDSRKRFVSNKINEQVAAQIRLLREDNGWTQTQLGDSINTPQTGISRLENPDYSGYSVRMLLRLAAVFDVGLVVRFAPFSELVAHTFSLTPESLVPENYDTENALEHRLALMSQDTTFTVDGNLIDTLADGDSVSISTGTLAGASVRNITSKDAVLGAIPAYALA